MPRNRRTYLVFPIDDGEPSESESESEAADDTLEWCFHDPELTRQLRAVKGGRGLIVATMFASVAVLGTALLLIA